MHNYLNITVTAITGTFLFALHLLTITRPLSLHRLSQAYLHYKTLWCIAMLLLAKVTFFGMGSFRDDTLMRMV